jgi:hypothetical protein
MEICPKRPPATTRLPEGTEVECFLYEPEARIPAEEES